MNKDQLIQLLRESYLLEKYIGNNIIIDAGSGNGILGIPISLINIDRKIILVESMKKKSIFLQNVKEKMSLKNVYVYNVNIAEYLKENMNKESKTLIARGFPGLSKLCDFVSQGIINEAVLITSENKIKKNQNNLESVTKKTYNIPLRENLKILKIFSRSN
jgi:16S rRNA G527 N7-methylase RsmG